MSETCTSVASIFLPYRWKFNIVRIICTLLWLSNLQKSLPCFCVARPANSVQTELPGSSAWIWHCSNVSWRKVRQVLEPVFLRQE